MLFRLKRLWYRLTHDKKKRNNSSAYVTVPYYYPTEKVDNVSRAQKRENVAKLTAVWHRKTCASF
jgi:hypothetical protein